MTFNELHSFSDRHKRVTMRGINFNLTISFKRRLHCFDNFLCISVVFRSTDVQFKFTFMTTWAARNRERRPRWR